MAVHLHIHYVDQLPKILCYLKSLAEQNYDLFVTTTAPLETLSDLKSSYPKAEIWNVPNLGYDIGPFIDFLHHIDLSRYEYILKLHTKGTKSKNYSLLNGNRFDNALWGRVLWDSQLATPERLAENIKILDNNPKIGMVGSKYCVTSALRDYKKLLPQINEELQKMQLAPVNKLTFVAGSMFLVRAKCLEPLLHYQMTDFAPTDANVKEGTLAHVVERIIGVVASPVKQISHQRYGLYFMIVLIKRFLFQKKLTNSGKKIVKILKIPVYSKLKTM